MGTGNSSKKKITGKKPNIYFVFCFHCSGKYTFLYVLCSHILLYCLIFWFFFFFCVFRIVFSPSASNMGAVLLQYIRIYLRYITIYVYIYTHTSCAADCGLLCTKYKIYFILCYTLHTHTHKPHTYWDTCVGIHVYIHLYIMLCTFYLYTKNRKKTLATHQTLLYDHNNVIYITLYRNTFLGRYIFYIYIYIHTIFVGTAEVCS